MLRSGGHGHANAHPRSRTRAWLQQQSSARAHPSTRIFTKKYDMNTHDSAWLRMDRAWSTMGALHRPPQSQDHAHVEHPSSYPHPHTHAPHRIRTAIDIDLRKSFQTEMISPPFHPRLFWSLVFSVRINQFRGIFTAKMRLVRLFPDACNGDVTCAHNILVRTRSDFSAICC